MISSCFELNPSVQQDDILHHLKMSGDIRLAVVTQNGWEFGVVFPDYITVREFFKYLLDQSIDFNVRWMVKDQNPFNESDRYLTTDLFT